MGSHRRIGVTFDTLVGLTLASIENVNDELIRFTTTCGRVFEQYHLQDCCEHVRVEDICGDVEDLIGSPILVAEEVTSDEDPSDVDADRWCGESFTWTFYKIDTAKGGVTIRWLGESNGYYSESVDFEEVTRSR